jgi:DNA/RNA endonuclease YhcR with UshA esterase domain
MTRLLQERIGIALLFSTLLFATMTDAQQKRVPQANLSYQVSREVSVQGSVISYSETSSVAPFGARVTLQTGGGAMDVHLGNGRLLESNHFTLSPGDSIRVVGENVAFGQGTQFLARIVQKGNQSVAVRSVRGLLLRPMSNRVTVKSSNQAAGAL